jgi:hypothetical protein
MDGGICIFTAGSLDVTQATSFFNMELLKGGLSVPQTQAVTGHKTERMTE